MRVTVPLAMFCLDAAQLNEELCVRTQNLRDALIEFEVMENRELNKRYVLLVCVLVAFFVHCCCVSVSKIVAFSCCLFYQCQAWAEKDAKVGV